MAKVPTPQREAKTAGACQDRVEPDRHRDSGDWFGVDVEQLSARLRFHPDDAHIWLESERMVLLHLTAFSSLRRELIEATGIETACKVLYRVGQVSGTLDAAIARRAMPHAGPVEAFKAGPRLHAIEGMVVPEQVRLELDAETGFHIGEWIWRHSAEADAHIQAFGIGAEPACWTLLGYASAYSSAFIGNPTLYREVECRAMGAPHCRIVGKPAALWAEEGGAGDVGLDLHGAAQSPFPGSFLGERIGGAGEWSGSAAGDALIGESPAFAAMMSTVRRIADTSANVLLLGEPGAGKKTVGRAIHRLSRRASRPLLVVNCARHDGDDLALDLFGRERSGDEPARPGKLERLNGGTLLLEDVQTITPRFQAKLMQLLVDRQVERLGGGQPRAIDIRVIACANDELARAVRDGRFRQDLYYKLGVCSVAVPPLRDRRGDLPALIRHFAGLHAAHYGKTLGGLTMDAAGYLLSHDFPGNIAELEAMMERAVIMASDDGMIRTHHLLSVADLHQPSFFRVSDAGGLVHSDQPDTAGDMAVQTERMLRGQFNLEAFEADLIQRAVAQAQGNLAQAARMLGITRPQLAYRYARLRGEHAD
ncbi:sigma-54-dependent Fis family transcriptional regulator [Novosphingobium sp. Fuku2-ISO-50]|uniref:sigma-54-dependent Fis family transcriptional regulator n=1 Tax=Novosphingobium sp. Fuku2-ISO-50 TaxID=1739114 RepID=UPI00076C7D6D|nr:sigma-54-dependent Fis family transcriptional regulator [Novosphingobium sp. Fuku2-ISO-50]KUR76765.1 hypothetical protein AQZ50_12940 [Novosphingobium sp. Fuku2-ISO-50]